MMKRLSFLLFLMPSVAFADVASMKSHEFDQAAEVLDGVAMNAAAATRTMTLPTRYRYSKIKVGISYTTSACSDLPIVVTCATDSAGAIDGVTTLRSCSAGSCDFLPITEYYCRDAGSYACATGENNLEYDAQGCYEMVVVVGGASGGTACDGSDLVDAVAVGLVGG